MTINYESRWSEWAKLMSDKLPAPSDGKKLIGQNI